MDAKIFEEIMERCEGSEEYITYLALNNEDEALEAIHKYDIYGIWLDKLFNLCNENYELFAASLETINGRPYIGKEMIYDNLSMEKPIPFVRNIYDGDNKSTTLRQIHYLFEAYTFYEEYKKYKKSQDNQNNQSKKR